ncbi:SDR family oxidoreductase [Amycolatopsis sp. NPDC049253]|uniref:SDR family NAD(P)-dependent oxidoreductase n=1 Tax=Amycolatopsis sp. NPDC049253 TaxID=3155274 RepID=UPI00342FD39B
MASSACPSPPAAERTNPWSATPHRRSRPDSSSPRRRNARRPARFLATDVTSAGEVDALVEAAAEFGGVDVMVCNAGITLPSDGAELAADGLHRLMAVNVDGVLFGAQAAARRMKALGKAGSIVLMGSMGGLRGAAVTIAYSTSKGGVVAPAKALADALGPDGIRVNAVCPGLIDTEMLRATPGVADGTEARRLRTPLRRLGRPAEIGDAVAWLGSDLSSYVSGIELPVDGGLISVI